MTGSKMTLLGAFQDLKGELLVRRKGGRQANLVDLINLETQKLCSAWFEAERLLKLCEKATDQVNFPSVNELRYAGRRLVHALGMIQGEVSGTGPDEDLWHYRQPREDGRVAGPESAPSDLELMSAIEIKAYGVLRDLVEATENCTKAAHDAIDEIFFELGASLDDLKKEYSLPDIKQQFGEWDSVRVMLRTVGELMAESRQATYERRTEIYRSIENQFLASAINHLNNIIDASDRLAESKAARSEEMSRLAFEDFKGMSYAYVTAGFAVGVVLVGIVAISFVL